MRILEVADLHPEWFLLEIGLHGSDNDYFTLLQSAVYRILQPNGLIRSPEKKNFPAGPEYRVKTQRVNEIWY
jgi:hypothetical protein